MARFQCYIPENGQFRWRLLGGNNRVLGVCVRQHTDHESSVREVDDLRASIETAQVDLDRMPARSVAASLWSGLLYQRVLPTSGMLGFIVSWYVTFLVLYLVVSVPRHGRTVVADRLASVVVTGGALLVGFALAAVVVKTFGSGWDALRHLNFFTEDMGPAGPLTPLDQAGMVHALIGTLIMIGIAIMVTAVPRDTAGRGTVC